MSKVFQLNRKVSFLKFFFASIKLFQYYFNIRTADTGKYEIVSPANVSAERPVPEHINKPEYYFQYIPPDIHAISKPEIKLEPQINAVRRSCELAATILDKVSRIVKVSIKFFK